MCSDVGTACTQVLAHEQQSLANEEFEASALFTFLFCLSVVVFGFMCEHGQ